jgi:hypothetical protein
VRFSVVAEEDIQAIGDGLGALARQDVRIPRLADGRTAKAACSRSWTCRWMARHAALGGSPPISRVTNLPSEHT